MSHIKVPSQQELVQRVADIAPVIRADAEWSSANGRLHDNTIKALTEAGLFRVRTPLRYGGYECDARTMVEVADALGRVDGSVAWWVAVSWVGSWITGQFSDALQDEVFADPDAQVSSTIGPAAVTAVPVEGGLKIDGTWPFISGAHSSGWQIVSAIVLDPAGEPYPMMGLVPTAELKLGDDWQAVGLQATGSVSTTAEDLFVPNSRFRPVLEMVTQGSASVANADKPLYQVPLRLMGAIPMAGIPAGLAKAVRDIFFERLPGRKITYTDYAVQAEAPVTHLRVGEAQMMIDESEFHARRLADAVDAVSATGTPFPMDVRTRSRADVGAAVQRAKQAAAIYAQASGGSSAYRRVPIQKILDDLQVFSLHANIVPDVNFEIYGRALCGLAPNPLYV